MFLFWLDAAVGQASCHHVPHHYRHRAEDSFHNSPVNSVKALKDPSGPQWTLVDPSGP